MKEIISLHVGQTGVKIGESCWELLCAEHGVQPDGQLMTQAADHDALFTETSDRRVTPRAVFIDGDFEAIDGLRKGVLGGMIHPDRLVSGKESTGGLFPRGLLKLGQEVNERVMNQIRKLVENCENLQGFFMFHSAGGGTGSGYSSRLLQELFAEYGNKKCKVEFSVYPSDFALSSILEPYNAVFHMEDALLYSDCTFMFDNRALSSICTNRMASFSDFNRRISHVVSSITELPSTSTSMLLNFDDLLTNLIPYPKIHFSLASLAPVVSSTTASYESSSVLDITRSCFHNSCQMAKCDLTIGTYLSCCMLYRGDVPLYDVNAAVEYIKMQKSTRFTEWCPNKVKVGIQDRPPVAVAGQQATEPSLCLLSNNTAVVQVWERLRQKFNSMLSKKAFLHWFSKEGIHFEDFALAEESLRSLINEYDGILQ